jgi:hypothetical protein
MINMGDTPDVAVRNKGMQVKDATVDVVNRSYNIIAIQTRTINSDTREKRRDLMVRNQYGKKDVETASRSDIH